MNKLRLKLSLEIPRAALAGALLLLAGVSSWAQDADPEPLDNQEPSPASQETEISEDNYRRFMELKDQPIERAMPIMQAPSAAGLENMQRLPEASQKHLRDQLRENILLSGPWSPGSEEGEYPFVPSTAAKTDQALLQNEAVAWEELVGQYHEREAAFYAGRNQRGAGQASAEGELPDLGGAPGSQAAQQNSGQAGGSAQSGGQSGQGQGQQAQNQAEQGQQGQGQQGQQQASDGASDSSAAQGSQQASSTSAEQQRARQASNPQPPSRQAPVRGPRPVEGSEQSALEFLTGKQVPPPERARSKEPSTPETSRRQAQSRGVLTLEQLEQAKGIGSVRPALEMDVNESNQATQQGGSESTSGHAEGGGTGNASEQAADEGTTDDQSAVENESASPSENGSGGGTDTRTDKAGDQTTSENQQAADNTP